jgi:hypothetical protein
VSNTLFVPATANFPQIGYNRSVNAIVTDLLDYTGGADRTGARERANRALNETIRLFNSMAWRFNRKTKDITFSSNVSDYELDPLTRDVWKVMLLDANNELVDDVRFTKYEDFLRYDGSTLSAVTIPDEYTLLNVFDTGMIRFLPRLGTTFSYPKARVFYHKRIAIPPTDSDVIAVPTEVETAIVRHAAALLVARTRTFEEAARARADGNEALEAAKREWRDFPDYMAKMG